MAAIPEATSPAMGDSGPEGVGSERAGGSLEKMEIADGGKVEPDGEGDPLIPDANKKRRQFCGYPISIFFILGTEFCERFSHYGFKAILVVYLTSVIGFADADGAALSHGFAMICMSMPMVGGVIADSCWGRYKTILIIALIYAMGNMVMAVTSIPALGAAKGNWYGPIVALIIIGFGTGGIKPNVSAFGADQFDKSDAKKATKFFSFFYAAINCGSLISMLITPVFKGNVQCFGQPCYLLAFGVPSILMVVAVIFHAIGGLIKGGYVKVPPKGTVFKDFCRCFNHALTRKRKLRKSGEKRSHWLDWADDRFPPKQIADVKAVLNVFVIFAPLALFWGLYDQQSTRWVLQSQRMDVRIGPHQFQPEQLQVLNPILILVLIPIFDFGIYPLVGKCKNVKDTPLRRIGAGMFLAVIAFSMSAVLEKVINDKAAVVLPSSQQCFLSVLNKQSVPIQIQIASKWLTVPSLKGSLEDQVGMPLTINWKLSTEPVANARLVPTLPKCNPKKERIVVVFVPTATAGTPEIFNYITSLEHPRHFKSKITITSTLVTDTIEIRNEEMLGAEGDIIKPGSSPESLELLPATYGLSVAGKKIKDLEILNGAIYSLSVFRETNGDLVVRQDTILPWYSLNIFLQIPQIVVMAWAEILVSITGMSFAYSQAPDTMKSLLQAGWYLTIFFGNLIDVIIMEIKLFEYVWQELFLFSGLILLSTIPFIIIATRYKYVDEEAQDKSQDEDKSQESIVKSQESGVETN